MKIYLLGIYSKEPPITLGFLLHIIITKIEFEDFPHIENVNYLDPAMFNPIKEGFWRQFRELEMEIVSKLKIKLE